MALDPDPPDELPDPEEVLEPPLDPLEPPLRGGGADLVGCDCGDGIEGISRELLPLPVELELGGGGGGASLVVVVRGIAWAAAMAGTDNPIAIAETRRTRLLMRMDPSPKRCSVQLYCHIPRGEYWSISTGNPLGVLICWPPGRTFDTIPP